MKIVIELKDFEEVFCDTDEYLDEAVQILELKKALVETAIDKLVGRLYHEYFSQGRALISGEVTKMIKEHQDEIIDKVITTVSDKILAKKAVVNEMPKKSEVVNISKEWENYFVELIDKAIAKRFK